MSSVELPHLYPQGAAAFDEEEGELPVSDPSVDIVKERANAVAANLKQPREDVDHVSDVDAGGVRSRLYVPAGHTGGVIVHLHGGGFVFNDIDVHDGLSRVLANRSGLAVLSIDFRRPPEDRFPAAPDDVDTAVAWLQAHAHEYGIDPADVHLHGDSAGACLALVAALRHPGRFRSMALIYPFIDASLATDSWEHARGLFDRREGAWYWKQYSREPGDYLDPDFTPSLASNESLAALPPTLVVTAEFDPCRDEGEILAARMADAGVSVIGTRVLGLPHGFYRHLDQYDAAEPTVRQVAGFLASHAG